MFPIDISYLLSHSKPELTVHFQVFPPLSTPLDHRQAVASGAVHMRYQAVLSGLSATCPAEATRGARLSPGARAEWGTFRAECDGFEHLCSFPLEWWYSIIEWG